MFLYISIATRLVVKHSLHLPKFKIFTLFQAKSNMIPLNILTKLVRSRSQVTIAKKTFKTLGPLRRENRDGSDRSKCCPQPGGSKSEDDGQGKESKKHQETFCQKDNQTKFSKECDTKEPLNKNKNCPSEGKYLESKKQGVSSFCGPIDTCNKGLEGKQQRTRKPRDLETNSCITENESSRHQLSRGCNCPPFNTPNIVEERDIMKEQKPLSTKRCPENDTPNCSKEQDECVSERSRENACESRKLKCPQKESQCGTGIQKISDPCDSTNLCRKNMCPQEKENLLKDKNVKKSQYCGPDKMSYKDSCPEDKSVCSNSHKQTVNDSCEPIKSSPTCYNQEKDCEDRPNNCQTKTSTKILCPEEVDCANIVKQFRHGPCKTSRRNVCSEVQDENCLDEQKRNISHEVTCKEEIKIPELPTCCKVEAAKECVCKLKDAQEEWQGVIKAQECRTPKVPEDECSEEQKQNSCQEGTPINEIKIPELPPCCKVEAAKECVCKLKEVQREWEEVIMAQEKKGEDHHDSVRGKVKKSNMIYVVLVAVLAAVLYYTYNSDFEYDELFLDQKELKEDDEKDDDDDD